MIVVDKTLAFVRRSLRNIHYGNPYLVIAFNSEENKKWFLENISLEVLLEGDPFYGPRRVSELTHSYFKDAQCLWLLLPLPEDEKRAFKIRFRKKEDEEICLSIKVKAA